MDQIKQMDLVYGAALMAIICAEPVPGKGYRDGKVRELQSVEELHPGLNLLAITVDLEGHEFGSIILRWETMRHLLSEGEIHDLILLPRSF
jgi:hypothetical protein